MENPESQTTAEDESIPAALPKDANVRDYFAASAPPKIPWWFACRQQFEHGPNFFVQDQRYFEWRWYYADKMMEERNRKEKEG